MMNPRIPFFFWPSNDVGIQISTDNIGFADWDEQEDAGLFNDPFYVMIDVHGTHHIVRFYQNDSLEIMRRIKNELPVEEE